MKFRTFSLPISFFMRKDRYYTGQDTKKQTYNEFFNSKTGLVMLVIAFLLVATYFGVLIDLMFIGSDDLYSEQKSATAFLNSEFLNMHKFNFMPMLTIRDFENNHHLSENGITDSNGKIMPEVLGKYVDIRLSVKYYKS